MSTGGLSGRNFQVSAITMRVSAFHRNRCPPWTVFRNHMSDEELEIVQQEFSRMSDKYAPLVDDDLAHVERELEARRRRE